MKQNRVVFYIFLTIEIILDALIFILEGYFNNIVSFLAIVNPFLYSLRFCSNKEKSVILTNIALFDIVVSDLDYASI